MDVSNSNEELKQGPVSEVDSKADNKPEEQTAPLSESTGESLNSTEEPPVHELKANSARRIFSTDGRVSNVPKKAKEAEISADTRAGLMELRHCKNERRAVTAKVFAIEGVSRDDARSAVAVLMYCHKGTNTGIKILIPFRKFLDADAFRMDPNYDEISNEMHALSLRQGSEVDVYITSVDENGCVAAGDRLSAMRDKESAYYKKDSENSVCEGDIVTSRIVSVNRRGVTVEALGVETSIPSRNLTYRHLSDITPFFHVGDYVDVLIKNINIDQDTGRVSLSDCSVKEALLNNEDPYVKASRILKVSGHYEGVVDYIDRNNGSFYVNPLHTDIDVYCPEPPIQHLPHVGDRVSVNVTVIDVEKKRFYGRIVHFAGKNSGTF